MNNKIEIKYMKIRKIKIWVPFAMRLGLKWFVWVIWPGTVTNRLKENFLLRRGSCPCGN